MAVATPFRVWSRSFEVAEVSARDNTTIRDVSLCTMGEAKGHGCLIDQTTLEQLLECSKKFRNGVRANLGHFTGTENAFGYIDNIRINGKKLLGDLHLFEEHPDFKLTLRQIQTIPDTIGFSVAFEGDDETREEDVNGEKASMRYARCEELFSVDLVTEPAANPDGVFQTKKSITVDKTLNAMDPDELKKLLKDHTDSVHAIFKGPHDEMRSKLDELQKHVESIGKNDTPVKAMDDEDTADEGKKKPCDDDEEGDDMNDTEFNAKMEKRFEAFEKSLTEKTLSALSSMGIKPGSASSTAASVDGAPEKKVTEGEFKNFQQAYRANRAKGLSKGESIKTAKASHWELYKEYCHAQERGEKVESLEVKDQTRLARMVSTGKLI